MRQSEKSLEVRTGGEEGEKRKKGQERKENKEYFTHMHMPQYASLSDVLLLPLTYSMGSRSATLRLLRVLLGHLDASMRPALSPL